MFMSIEDMAKGYLNGHDNPKDLKNVDIAYQTMFCVDALVVLSATFGDACFTLKSLEENLKGYSIGLRTFHKGKLRKACRVMFAAMAKDGAIRPVDLLTEVEPPQGSYEQLEASINEDEKPYRPTTVEHCYAVENMAAVILAHAIKDGNLHVVTVKGEYVSSWRTDLGDELRLRFARTFCASMPGVVSLPDLYYPALRKYSAYSGDAHPHHVHFCTVKPEEDPRTLAMVLAVSSPGLTGSRDITYSDCNCILAESLAIVNVYDQGYPDVSIVKELTEFYKTYIECVGPVEQKTKRYSECLDLLTKDKNFESLCSIKYPIPRAMAALNLMKSRLSMDPFGSIGISGEVVAAGLRVRIVLIDLKTL